MVIDPRFYKEQLDELGIEGLEIDPSSEEEALELLGEVEEAIRNLKRIRYNLHLDMRLIRREYLEKLKDPQVRADVKRRRALIDERDSTLGPYEGVDRIIDTLLDQLEEAAISLREYAGLEDAAGTEGW
ncbi:hypothetical protein DNK57_03095 [Methanothermobacter thermautotrophicus]|uniref:Uncharacterized protein n=1 Tax=Methanothermobacter thermautotrophicus TaxID=145262 RepID=A0A842YMH5_METTF|nr:hypothetical protein [Methanothermobacter thermautotrophicus]MBE2899810.1 hypothetical protein [Methanothermobacter thermautotrophicus]